jgi:hypothetical protein
LGQVLPHGWNPRSKLRGILLRRINGKKNAHQREEDEMQRYEHLTLRAAFRAGGTSKVNFINDEAVGEKQIAFYPYLNSLAMRDGR